MARPLFNANIYNQKSTASNRCNGPNFLKDESFNSSGSACKSFTNSSNLSGMSNEELCDLVIELKDNVRDMNAVMVTKRSFHETSSELKKILDTLDDIQNFMSVTRFEIDELKKSERIKQSIQRKLTEQLFEKPVDLIDFKRFLQNDFDSFLNFILKDSCKTLRRIR